MERQAAEIQNYRSTGDDLKDTLDNKEALLNSHKEVCISQYEDVDVLSELLRTETMDRDMMEERAVESSEVIKLQEAELKTLQQALKNSRYIENKQFIAGIKLCWSSCLRPSRNLSLS